MLVLGIFLAYLVLFATYIGIRYRNEYEGVLYCIGLMLGAMTMFLVMIIYIKLGG